MTRVAVVVGYIVLALLAISVLSHVISHLFPILVLIGFCWLVYWLVTRA